MVRESYISAAWRQNKFLPLVACALFLLNIAVFFFLETALFPEIDLLERQYIEQQALLREGKRGGGGSELPWRAYSRASSEMAVFYQAIPHRENFTNLIREIFSLAEKSGLAIDMVDYRPEKVKERDILLYSLNFSVVGDYGQIKKFIHRIEQSKRLIMIDEVGLKGESGGGGSVSLHIRLSTLFRTGES